MSTAIFGKTTKCEGCEGQDTQRIHRLRRGSRRVFRWGRRQLRRRSRVKRQRMLGGEAGVRVVNVYKILCIYLLYRCMMYTYLYNIIIYIYILYTHTHISPSLSLSIYLSDLIWFDLISSHLMLSHLISSYLILYCMGLWECIFECRFQCFERKSSTSNVIVWSKKETMHPVWHVVLAK